ncbi:trimeric LpxA-like protein [Emericellopsis atlantica]|uniref:Dynactin subunit 5 n=1 Tax=Emericellopsis atlantica TaxID=2614577 RepID=A0A9P7ZPD8_9HYPO|nr:trimeric LpxA-like protein [Emericellopsis atlantica]KAG9255833.1 trimeric LpxA-like protein [Emericellopsis atlantica]
MSRRQVKGDYIETETGNKVSRKANLLGTQNMVLGGKVVIQPEVMIRGDLVRTAPSSSSSGGTTAPSTTAIQTGRYCFFSKGVVLRPPGRRYKGQFSHMPMRIGHHVFIGQDTVVQAATIGDHVRIGKNCVIGEFAIIKECVEVLDGAVVPPNMVIPNYSIVAGQPARVVGEVPEGGGPEENGLRGLYSTVGNNPQNPDM